MLTFTIYNSIQKPSTSEKDRIVNFLYTSLENYGDPKSAISKCFDFAVKNTENALGGFALVASEDDTVLGAVLVNKTGMSEYIPENILVYIAVDKNARGKGVGKQLMTKTIALAEGDVALHVEPDNPAKILYEKVGFTNKYLEMRYQK